MHNKVVRILVHWYTLSSALLVPQLSWDFSTNPQSSLMKCKEGRGASKNPPASFPFICVSSHAFKAFSLTLAVLVSLGTLISSGIHKLLSTLPGNPSDVMSCVTSLRPFAAAPLNCSLQGLPHLPLVPSKSAANISPALLHSLHEWCHSMLCYLLLKLQTVPFSQWAGREKLCRFSHWHGTCWDPPHKRALLFDCLHQGQV